MSPKSPITDCKEQAGDGDDNGRRGDHWDYEAGQKEEEDILSPFQISYLPL